MNGIANKRRVVTIDIARFYAMALVFYGHFIEEFMLLKNPVGADQYKLIYSFHMVLFIVLAGYVAKIKEIQWPVSKFLKNRFFSRLLPFLFFTIVMMIPPIFFHGKFYGLVLPSVAGYTKGLISSFFGLPYFCVPSWFLLLIIGMELVHFTFYRFLKNSDTKILIAGIVFYLVGYTFNLKIDLVNPLKGRLIGWNYFFIQEAVTLYPFYLLGLYLRNKKYLTQAISAKVIIPGVIVSLLIVLTTYRLNHGPFKFSVYNAVVIMFSSHGNILLFPLTAIAGCAFILFLAHMTPNFKIITWLGQNTLTLMCLNGIFYHYINPDLAKWILAHFSGTGLIVSAAGIITTGISLAFCIPLIFVLNKSIPQLVGKPKQSGPFLRNLISA